MGRGSRLTAGAAPSPAQPASVGVSSRDSPPSHSPGAQSSPGTRHVLLPAGVKAGVGAAQHQGSFMTPLAGGTASLETVLDKNLQNLPLEV